MERAACAAQRAGWSGAVGLVLGIPLLPLPPLPGEHIAWDVGVPGSLLAFLLEE